MALNRYRLARDADSYVVLDLGEPREGGVYVHDDDAVAVAGPFPFSAAGKGDAAAETVRLNAADRRARADAAAETGG